MFATDTPPAWRHPPLAKGRVGEGSCLCVALFFQIGIIPILYEDAQNIKRTAKYAKSAKNRELLI